jgi:hypothetical protein
MPTGTLSTQSMRAGLSPTIPDRQAEVSSSDRISLWAAGRRAAGAWDARQMLSRLSRILALAHA